MHAEDLRRYLAEATGRPVRLRLNTNTHSMISARRDGTGPGIAVSLHRIFLDGDEAVMKALAQFLVGPTPAARATIRGFIDARHAHIAEARAAAPRPARVVRGSARGQHFNLQTRADFLNEHYFGGTLKYRIIWGRGSGSDHRQRHVTLGTWNDRQRIIRIHPMLDSAGVPLTFLDFVIYHEMVHIAVPSRTDGAGRIRHHTPEFYALERRFAQHAFAVAWEGRWIKRLIEAWHGGRPLPANACEPPVT